MPHEPIQVRSVLTVGSRDVPCAGALPAPPIDGGPGVILVHDIFGLTPVAIGHATRLAAHGYAVIAPDLFALGGPKVTCVIRTMGDFRRRSGVAWDILEASRDRLVTEHAVDPTRIGVMGFCMGGGFALLFAQRAGLAVAAPFYGEAPTEVLEATDLCPIVGGWGERDRVFAAHGHRLADHLRQAGVDHDVVIYPGVGHSYMDDHHGVMARLGRLPPLRAEYNPSAAEDSWSRVLAFFNDHL